MAQKTQKVNTEKREKELFDLFGEVESAKIPFIKALIHDFCVLEEMSKRLEGLPTVEIDEKNPKRQRKLPAHDMLKEVQQRKTEVTRALLREIGGESAEESPLQKALMKYETR